jgi:hypothetical protein
MIYAGRNGDRFKAANPSCQKGLWFSLFPLRSNLVFRRLFQNPGLLGIISGLFERKGVRGVCLSWLTSRRFSTICNVGFSPALTDELGPLSALDQQFCEVIALTDLGRFIPTT